MKYMLLINSGGINAEGGAEGCTVEDWMDYDKEVSDPGGFYVIDVPDLDAALHWAARSPAPSGDRAC